jgi:hypothetical protein
MTDGILFQERRICRRSHRTCSQSDGNTRSDLYVILTLQYQQTLTIHLGDLVDLFKWAV